LAQIRYSSNDCGGFFLDFSSNNSTSFTKHVSKRGKTNAQEELLGGLFVSAKNFGVERLVWN